LRFMRRHLERQLFDPIDVRLMALQGPVASWLRRCSGSQVMAIGITVMPALTIPVLVSWSF
jgi:hypothetical protein